VLNTQPLPIPSRRLLGLLARALVFLGLATWGTAACGSEAVCPTGTQGDPCRPITDLGSQPELPTAADTSLGVWDALGADAQDTGSQADAPTTNQDSNTETQGTDTAAGDAPADAPDDTASQPDEGDGDAGDTGGDTGTGADIQADTAPDATTDTTGDTPAPADSARAEGAATRARVAALLGPPGKAGGARAPRLAHTPARRSSHRG